MRMYVARKCLAGCDLFLAADGLPDPCAEEDLTCSPGSEGFNCGKWNNIFHELSALLRQSLRPLDNLPISSS